MTQTLKALAKPGRQVTVIGDTIVDRVLVGTVEKFAQEAPGCPVFEVDEEYGPGPGGAAYIASQLALFGANVHFITMAADDECVQRVLEPIRQLGRVSCVSDAGYVNAFKTRMFVRRDRSLQLVHRLDYPQQSQSLPAMLRLAEMRNYIDMVTGGQSPQDQILVIADYNKGVFDGMAGTDFNRCPRHKLIRNLRQPRARGTADLAVLNRNELMSLTAEEPADTPVDRRAASLVSAGRPNLDACRLVVTGGGTAPLCLATNGHWEEYPIGPGMYVPNADPVGASDVLIAFAALLLAQDHEPTLAELAAAGAAAASVPGTSVVPLTRVFKRIAAEVWADAADAEALPALMRRLRAGTRFSPVKIGFTNGCFDALHAGHVKFLRAARAQCDFLIIGVNADESVRALKGDGRPLQSFEQRCEALREFGYCELIVKQTGSTPHALLSAIQPDILFKGYGYTAEEDAVGHEVITANGGKIQIIADGLPGFSTTAVVRAARQETDITDA